MNKGAFIVLEGNDGAGKTTALYRIRDLLEERGYDVLTTREPGGSPIAEQIRAVLLDPKNRTMTPEAEALLYAASRAQHVHETILPALEQGKIVLCDRFLDSSLAYQGAGRNLGYPAVEAINDFGIKGFRPDLTLFFSLPSELSEKRVKERGNLDRLDQESRDFHLRVRQGFEDRIAANPEKTVRIDASPDPETVALEGLKAVLERLEKMNGE